ncbi:MAG: serpin family protein [Planctomycetes bacterium]|nr:serpin family protein [Planctomycetota bacterium]
MYHRDIKPMIIVLFLLALALVAGLTSAQSEGHRPARPIVEASNDFSFALAPRLDAEGNMFFSPASISTALYMAYAGARGETAAEMARVLGIEDFAPTSAEFERSVRSLIAQLDREIDDDRRPGHKRPDGGRPVATLSLANALWGQKGHPFRADYLRRLKEGFLSELHQLDFAGDPRGSRQAINDQIARDTHDKIRDLLPPDAISDLTRLVLTNAIYFKNAWAEPFSDHATQDQDFELAAGKPVSIPMMARRSAFDYLERDDMRVLRLPYAQGDQSMVIVLPSRRHDLATVEKSLTGRRLDALLGKLAATDVILRLPRFKIERKLELAEILSAMGMKRAFGGGDADFGGIDDGAGQLFISRAIHQSYVAVDEKGTEAAAATALIMKVGSAMQPSKPLEFCCDEPFLFFIVDGKSGLILFHGRCADPRG